MEKYRNSMGTQVKEVKAEIEIMQDHMKKLSHLDIVTDSTSRNSEIQAESRRLLACYGEEDYKGFMDAYWELERLFALCPWDTRKDTPERPST